MDTAKIFRSLDLTPKQEAHMMMPPEELDRAELIAVVNIWRRFFDELKKAK